LTLTPLVAPRKNHQKSPQYFWRRRIFATKWYITLWFKVKAIVRIRVRKLRI